MTGIDSPVRSGGHRKGFHECSRHATPGRVRHLVAVPLGDPPPVLGVVHDDLGRPLDLGPRLGVDRRGAGGLLAGLGVFATAYYIGYVVSNAGGGFLTDWLGARNILAGSLFVAGGFMVLFGSSPRPASASPSRH